MSIDFNEKIEWAVMKRVGKSPIPFVYDNMVDVKLSELPTCMQLHFLYHCHIFRSGKKEYLTNGSFLIECDMDEIYRKLENDRR